MKTLRLTILTIIFSLAAACGGGSSGGSTPPPNDDPGGPVGGIGRTGIAQGPISTFGSVVVNGVRYDTSSASFTINGETGSESDLEVGQVVTVSGTIDDNGVDGSADDAEDLDAAGKGSYRLKSKDFDWACATHPDSKKAIHVPKDGEHKESKEREAARKAYDHAIDVYTQRRDQAERN